MIKILQVFILLFSPLGALGYDENPNIIYVPEGMGTTTGFVVKLGITNTSDNVVLLKLGPYLIPSADTTQGYVIPDSYQIRLEKGEQLNLPLYGYCTNPFLPPVSLGGRLKPFKEWVPENEGIEMTVKNCTEENGFINISPCGQDTINLTYPVRNEVFCYHLDIDEFPRSSVSMVVDLAKRVESAFKALKKSKGIDTPFGYDQLKEKESVIQQTIWIALCKLEGSVYDYDVFMESVEKQYLYRSNNMGKKLSEAEIESLNNGLKRFWNTFLSVGVEANLFSIVSYESAE